MTGNGKYCLWLGEKNQFIFFVIALCTTLFFIAGFFPNPNTTPQKEIQGQVQLATEIVASNGGSLSKELLPELDKELYKQIFHEQKSAKWEVADANIAKLSSKILLGDVLAERYLNPSYETTSTEITDWLKNYPGNLKTAEIMELAKNKFPEVFTTTAKIEKPQRLQGYGDGNADDIRFDDNKIAKKLWLSGIEAWRANKKPQAANYFSNLTKQKDLSDWQYSAANFWAYRAFSATGDKNKADYYLAEAAGNPRVFYGILANKKLNKPLDSIPQI